MSNDNNKSEGSGQSKSGDGKRRGKRRYFRRKNKQTDGGAGSGPAQKGPEQKGPEKKRSDKKRAENKSRGSNASGKGSDKQNAAGGDSSKRGKNAPRDEADRSKNRRRRRRSKSRRGQGDSGREASVMETINYVAPESVFVYTHVLRPQDSRDSYEYRPEHFSGRSRSLEDFSIDLAPLFAERPPISARLVDDHLFPGEDDEGFDSGLPIAELRMAEQAGDDTPSADEGNDDNADNTADKNADVTGNG